MYDVDWSAEGGSIINLYAACHEVSHWGSVFEGMGQPDEWV